MNRALMEEIREVFGPISRTHWLWEGTIEVGGNYFLQEDDVAAWRKYREEHLGFLERWFGPIDEEHCRRLWRHLSPGTGWLALAAKLRALGLDVPADMPPGQWLSLACQPAAQMNTPLCLWLLANHFALSPPHCLHRRAYVAGQLSPVCQTKTGCGGFA
jgi:hypothetical protein